MQDKDFWRSADKTRKIHYRGTFTLDPDDPYTILFFTPYDKYSVPITEGNVVFEEKIMPFAFSDSIRAGKVLVLYEHNPDHVLGVQGQNVTIDEKRDGLRCRLKLEPMQMTPYEVSILDAVGDGQLACSVGFQASKALFVREGVRHVQEAELFEISLVRNPAYPQTSSCTTPPPPPEYPTGTIKFTEGVPPDKQPKKE